MLLRSRSCTLSRIKALVGKNTMKPANACNTKNIRLAGTIHLAVVYIKTNRANPSALGSSPSPPSVSTTTVHCSTSL